MKLTMPMPKIKSKTMIGSIILENCKAIAVPINALKNTYILLWNFAPK